MRTVMNYNSGQTTKNYKDYVRHTKTKNGGIEYIYTFEYSHTVSVGQTYTPGSKPEYLKKLKNGDILVFVENLEKRQRIILDESKVLKPGRKFGSKDSYKRTRNSK